MHITWSWVLITILEETHNSQIIPLHNDEGSLYTGLSIAWAKYFIINISDTLEVSLYTYFVFPCGIYNVVYGKKVWEKSIHGRKILLILFYMLR
jgi:hypothetical protein